MFNNYELTSLIHVIHIKCCVNIIAVVTNTTSTLGFLTLLALVMHFRYL